jgi:hypothetical protein
VLCDRLVDGRVDLEPEASGHRHRAKHAYGIFLKALRRIADRSDDAVAQVVEAAGVVDDREGRDVVEQRVDREVASEGILFRRAERVVTMDQSVELSISRFHIQRDWFCVVGVRQLRRRDLAAKGGDFDRLRAEANVRQAEPPSDDPAVAEESLDLVRVRVGADIEIFGMATEQEVADAAADEVAGEVVLVQPIQHLQGVRVDLLAGDGVLRARHDHRTAMRPGTRILFSLRVPHSGPSRAKRGKRYWQPAKKRARGSSTGGVLGGLTHRGHCSNHAGMRPALLLCLLLSCVAPAWAADPPALAKARAEYNEGNYDSAIAAAALARRQPQGSDAAALVMARALLEKYRQGAAPSDLSEARDILVTIRHAALAPRDQVDLLIGLGQSLYLADNFGAAAELFDVAWSRSALLDERDRLMLLDWWATTLDRDAQGRSADRRPRVFERITQRMEEELRRDPGSAPANYWLAVAARGVGDLDGAWADAIAAWVRAALSPQTAEALRADLDRLVTQALIPERARTRPARDQTDAANALRAEWEMLKSQWKAAQ